MELELGLALALPNHDIPIINGNKSYSADHKSNHNHHDDQSIVISKAAFCSNLLVWSGQPNEEEDDDDDNPNSTTMINPLHNEYEGETNEFVGWPPINSLRKELLYHHHGRPADGDGGGNNRAVIRNNTSMMVKVRMEGVAIGRKIDLALCRSYPALLHSLLNMFGMDDREKSEESFRILYRDREGNWMHVADVPWETFVESVQRMEIVTRGSYN